MFKNRFASWLLVSMVCLSSNFATAEPQESESTWSTAVAAPSAEGQEGRESGVVIEEIPKGSTLEKAGLLVGDVITAWKRLPNPPANPETAEGAMDSYFDWQELEVEQAPRGTVVLRGRRGREPLELTVVPGLWEVKVRPVLPPALDAFYTAGKARVAAGDLEAGLQEWKPLKLTGYPEGADGNDLRAWITLRSGEVWGAKNEWEKAADAFLSAVDVAESPVARVGGWEAVGEAHEKRRELEAAYKAFSSALQVGQTWHPESLLVASSLERLGTIAWLLGDLERASDHFARALSIQEHLAPDSLCVATSLGNLGVVALARKDWIGAQDLSIRALRIEENLAPQSLNVAVNLKNLAVAAFEGGAMDVARDYVLRALQLEEQIAPGSLHVASSLNKLGKIAFERGELGLAQGYMIQSLLIRETLAPKSRALAATLANLGGVAWARGDLAQAQDYMLRGLHIMEAISPRSRDVASNLNNLGAVARARAELGRARDYHNRAFQLWEQLSPGSLNVAISLNNLGTVAMARGELSQAKDYMLRSLRLKEAISPGSLSVANTLTNLGALAQVQGDLDSAEDYCLQALKIQDEMAPQSLAVANSLHFLGVIARIRGKLRLARDYHFRAVEIQEKLAPETLDLVASLASLGAVARAGGEVNSAVDYYARALETLERQLSRLGGSYDAQASFQAQHPGYYLDFLDLFLTQNRLPEAFRVLERFRAQIFLAMLTERDTAFTADIPRELDRERRRLGVLYDRTLKTLAGLNPRDNADALEATRQELQKLGDEAGDIEARIRSASPKLADLRYPQPLDAAAAQRALDPGTLLLSFSVGKEKTWAFALSRSEDLQVKDLPLGDEALRTRVKQFLDLLEEAEGGSSLGDLRKRRVESLGRELYVALLGPLAERIAKSERLLILPDGPLHALPFAALVHDTEDGPHLLAAWKPLHVALSATVYAELKQRRRPVGQEGLPAPFQLAAFGDPIYPQNLATLKNASLDALSTEGANGAGRGDPTVRGAAERGLFDFQPLPYTRREVLGIASLFPEGTVRTFLGPEALEERIKSLDPKTRILHLAAHGSVDEHLPSGSFIALTIPEEAPSDDIGLLRDNGLLQVWEIFERVRLNADLVVLSACETGRGEELGGEGLIGLTRAFQYAGARSVLASLWNVNDQATSELMFRFYKHLLAGLPKDRALQAAQRELIAGPIEILNEKGEPEVRDFSAPYYWAGFQLYGDWQ